MKTKLAIFIALLGLTACNNSNKEELAKLKDQVHQDSVLLVQSKQKDSTIASYTDAMVKIQQKLDSIKMREKIITPGSNPESATPGTATSITADINALDALILSYNKKINSLAAKLKKSARKDAEMEKIIADLTQQLTGKEAEVSAMQTRLSMTSDSVKTITARFNDSLAVIQKQRGAISAMTAENNTVYYIAGTDKQLAKAGVIDKTGGFIGMGKTKELNPNADNSQFIKANKTTLNAIPLNGKFKGLITQHETGTYRVSGVGKADTLHIIDPAFWNNGRYLVVSVK